MLLNKFQATPATCVAFNTFVVGTSGDADVWLSVDMMGANNGASSDDKVRALELRNRCRGLTAANTALPDTACCHGLPPCNTS